VAPTLRLAEDLAELARRGAAVSVRSRLFVVRCCDCGTQYLYDEHRDRLFLDAGDLAQTWLDTDDGPAPACRGCGRVDWMFEDVDAADIEDVLAGPWGWCYWRPAAAAPVRTTAARVVLFALVLTILVLGAVSLAANPDPLGAPRPLGDVHVGGSP
jgi:hypothetical protein